MHVYVYKDNVYIYCVHACVYTYLQFSLSLSLERLSICNNSKKDRHLRCRDKSLFHLFESYNTEYPQLDSWLMTSEPLRMPLPQRQIDSVVFLCVDG